MDRGEEFSFFAFSSAPPLQKVPYDPPPKPIRGSTSKNKEANWSFRLISLRNEGRGLEAGEGRRQGADRKESASWGWWIADVCSCQPACAYLHSYAPKLCICVLCTCHMGIDVSLAAALSYRLSFFFFPPYFFVPRHQKQPHWQMQTLHVGRSRKDSSDVLQTRHGNRQNYKYTPFHPQEPVRKNNMHCVYLFPSSPRPLQDR